MKIRRFRDKDAVKTSRCIARTLKQVISKHYSSRVVAHLRKINLPGSLVKRAKKCTMVVAEENSRIIGTANLSNDGWLGAFFVDTSCIGHGVGSHLLREMERIAKKERFKAIRTHSAINAVGFYRKNGYRTVKPVFFKDVGKTYRMFKQI